MIPVWGFATATNTLVSYLIGLKQYDKVLNLIFKIVALCFAGVLLIVGLGILFPDLIMGVYTNDADLIEMGIPVLKIVSIGALFLSIGFILFNGISGTGKTNVSLTIELIVLAVYLTYTYLVINVFDGTIMLAWTSEIVYGLLLSLLSFAYLKLGNWQKVNI